MLIYRNKYQDRFLFISSGLFISIQDINSLYAEVLREMDEFTELSNLAWKGMIAARRTPVPENAPHQDAFNGRLRGKRQYGAGDKDVSGGNKVAAPMRSTTESVCNCVLKV